MVKGVPFFSQMFCTFQDRTSVFITLRYEENGSLLSLLNRTPKLPVDCARNIIVEVSLGLQYLHGNKIVHGDLKPENILMDMNFRAHIADFGCSLELTQNEGFFGQWGTATYRRPEQLLGNQSCDGRVDIFVAGIIFVQMIIGRHPFEMNAKNDVEVHRNIVKM